MAAFARRQISLLPDKDNSAKNDEWVDTSIRLSDAEIDKLDGVAVRLYTTRNGALNAILDAAASKVIGEDNARTNDSGQ
jgi:hypothetical protein